MIYPPPADPGMFCASRYVFDALASQLAWTLLIGVLVCAFVGGFAADVLRELVELFQRNDVWRRSVRALRKFRA